MWWLCLIFISPPNFCRILPLLHALNWTHTLMLKHSWSLLWNLQGKLAETKVGDSSQTSCETITIQKRKFREGCLSRSIWFSLVLTPSLHCFCPLGCLCISFSLPPFLSSDFHCFSTCTSPNMAPHWLHIPFLFQHLINCAPVPNSLETKSDLPILGRISLTLSLVLSAMMTGKDHPVQRRD